MRHAISGVMVAAAVACGSAAFAQSSQTPSSSQKATDKPMAFVGCLEQSQRTTAPTSGAFSLSTPTPAAPTAEAKRGAADAPSSSARPAVPPIDAGDTGRAESKVAGTFVLDGAPAELSKHVGHKVEITGVLKPGAT